MTIQYTQDLPDSFFAAMRAMNNRLVPHNPQFAAWALTIMQSESGIHPNMQDHGGAPYYGLIGLGAPGFAPMSPEDFKALSATQQVPYVEKFYRGAPVSKFQSAGNLYQWNFVPASTGRGLGPDTVIVAKGGTGYNGAEDNFYTSNALLDTNHDGRITVSDLDARLAKVAQDPRTKEAISRLPPPAAEFQANISAQPSSGLGKAAGAVLAGGLLVLAIRHFTKKG